LDANRGTGQDKAGFTLRRPCGVVVAITPFNYPASLVLHKLAPALAAGNAVVLKPATSTPLTALALAGCFVDAGLPEGVLSVLVGSVGVLGDLLVADPGTEGLLHRLHRDRRAHRTRRESRRVGRLRQRRTRVHLRPARGHALVDHRRLPRSRTPRRSAWSAIALSGAGLDVFDP
jgi:hypothetical protein